LTNGVLVGEQGPSTRKGRFLIESFRAASVDVISADLQIAFRAEVVAAIAI